MIHRRGAEDAELRRGALSATAASSAPRRFFLSFSGHLLGAVNPPRESKSVRLTLLVCKACVIVSRENLAWSMAPVDLRNFCSGTLIDPFEVP